MNLIKYTKYVLYVLLLICIIAGGLFFFGGKHISATGVSVPAYMQLLIYTLIGMLLFTVALTFLIFIVRWISHSRRSPKAAVRSVLGFFILTFVLLFCWLCGNSTLLPLQSYNSTYNTPFWLRITDMFLYSVYLLIGGAVMLIIGFYIAKKVR
jgi:hypothetical protein